MNKREFVKGLALVVGAAAAGRLAASGHAIDMALAYTPRTDTLESDGRLLTCDELHTLHDICQQVIPASDTPGAAELDVHGFLDNQLFLCHTGADQQRVRNVLEAVERAFSAEQGGQPFAGAESAAQLALLEKLDTGQPPFADGVNGDFRFLKSLIAFGYFTTEVGANRGLHFLPYPGGFKGSIPWRPDQRDWFG